MAAPPYHWHKVPLMTRVLACVFTVIAIAILQAGCQQPASDSGEPADVATTDQAEPKRTGPSEEVMAVILGPYKNKLEPSIILEVKGFALIDGQGRAIITHADIVEYNWDSHTITLRPGLRQRLHDELGQPLLWGVGFTVVADGVACFDGKLKSSLSSFSSDSIVIDLFKQEELENDQVRITLG